MDASKKKTGLGAAAFFQSPSSEPVPESGQQSPQPQVAVETRPAPLPLPPKSEKMRTTVMLSPDTLAAMDQYKVLLKRQRKKQSYSEIIDEALRLLFRVKEGEIQP